MELLRESVIALKRQMLANEEKISRNLSEIREMVENLMKGYQKPVSGADRAHDSFHVNHFLTGESLNNFPPNWKRVTTENINMNLGFVDSNKKGDCVCEEVSASENKTLCHEEVVTKIQGPQMFDEIPRRDLIEETLQMFDKMPKKKSVGDASEVNALPFQEDLVEIDEPQVFDEMSRKDIMERKVHVFDEMSKSELFEKDICLLDEMPKENNESEKHLFTGYPSIFPNNSQVVKGEKLEFTAPTTLDYTSLDVILKVLLISNFEDQKLGPTVTKRNSTKVNGIVFMHHSMLGKLADGKEVQNLLRIECPELPLLPPEPPPSKAFVEVRFHKIKYNYTNIQVYMVSLLTATTFELSLVKETNKRRRVVPYFNIGEKRVEEWVFTLIVRYVLIKTAKWIKIVLDYMHSGTRATSSMRRAIPPLKRHNTVLVLSAMGSGVDLTELQRMGISLIIAVMSMVSAGVVKHLRLRHGCKNTSSLSIFWQVPQYVLIGASEVYMLVGQLEFFNRQVPDGLKSLGSALSMTSISLGNYASSLILTIVTKILSSGDRPGWIPWNLNRGDLDRFYYLLGGLAMVDLMVYVDAGVCEYFSWFDPPMCDCSMEVIP
ncbi:hypothetical protein BUALT_Bualt19G0028500 [Buddleja alternifolia]|uniref:Uncharacterized protein n=1 Tax=Buddleja alternifolia TaxID=168488 RepID=A0AAV6W8C7_9LAMI|nr:hypothetical protein BUALT_Bualt19G0028500 [Buddleja alternifolia]